MEPFLQCAKTTNRDVNLFTAKYETNCRIDTSLHMEQLEASFLTDPPISLPYYACHTKELLFNVGPVADLIVQSIS